MLARGSLLEKLQLSFRALDAEGAGAVSKNQLFKFVVSVLALQFAAAPALHARAPAELHALAAPLARWLTAEVFRVADKDHRARP